MVITQEHFAVGPNLYRVMFEKKGKTSAVRKTHFNLTGTDDEIANAAIDKTVAFSTQWEWKLNYLTTRLIIQNS
jgi:hypothetical protein